MKKCEKKNKNYILKLRMTRKTLYLFKLIIDMFNNFQKFYNIFEKIDEIIKSRDKTFSSK